MPHAYLIRATLVPLPSIPCRPAPHSPQEPLPRYHGAFSRPCFVPVRYRGSPSKVWAGFPRPCFASSRYCFVPSRPCLAPSRPCPGANNLVLPLPNIGKPFPNIVLSLLITGQPLPGTGKGLPSTGKGFHGFAQPLSNLGKDSHGRSAASGTGTRASLKIAQRFSAGNRVQCQQSQSRQGRKSCHTPPRVPFGLPSAGYLAPLGSAVRCETRASVPPITQR